MDDYNLRKIMPVQPTGHWCIRCKRGFLKQLNMEAILHSSLIIVLKREGVTLILAIS